MKLHCISDLDFNEIVFKLVFQNRKFQAELSLSSAGFPTIGYGFNLQDDRALIPVLESLGFDVHAKQLKGDTLAAEQYYIGQIRSAMKVVGYNDTESLNNVVQGILAARLTDKRYPRCHHYKRTARLVYEDKAAVMQCVKAMIKNYEKTVDRWLMAFDMEIVNHNPQLFARKSKERIVLFSLAYQGIIGLKPNKTPLFPALGNAFILDNRALAWYYIRYSAFAGDDTRPETVLRRYYESELFGLYDAGVSLATFTASQYRAITSMFHEYKGHIIDHERRFSAGIPKANEKYGLAAENAIKTLEQSFAFARNHAQHTKKVQSLPTTPTAVASLSAPSSRKQHHKTDNVTYLNTAFVG